MENVIATVISFFTLLFSYVMSFIFWPIVVAVPIIDSAGLGIGQLSGVYAGLFAATILFWIGGFRIYKFKEPELTELVVLEGSIEADPVRRAIELEIYGQAVLDSFGPTFNLLHWDDTNLKAQLDALRKLEEAINKGKA